MRYGCRRYAAVARAVERERARARERGRSRATTQSVTMSGGGQVRPSSQAWLPGLRQTKTKNNVLL